MDDVWVGRPGVLLVAEQLRRRVPGGIGRYVRGLLAAWPTLRQAGDDVPAVTLYASRPAVPGEGWRVGHRAARRVDPLEAFGHRVETSRLPGPLLTRLWDRDLVRAPSGFDVVHSVSLAVPGAPRPGPARAAQRPGRHRPRRGVAASSRGLPEPGATLARGRVRAGPAPRLAFRGALDAVADDLVAAGAPAGAVVVIPLGSDLLPGRDDEGGHGPARASRRARRVPAVGGHARAAQEPGPAVGEAYGAARHALPGPWPLVVVGPPGWGPELEHGEGIVFTGRVEEGVLAALYARARLLAYVPFDEGFGFPPVEAMRYGTPVVASPMPTPGGAALVVDPTKVEDIAAALVRLATDDVLRADLAAAGRARAGSLTWEAAARAHVALWSTLL